MYEHPENSDTDPTQKKTHGANEDTNTNIGWDDVFKHQRYDAGAASAPSFGTFDRLHRHKSPQEIREIKQVNLTAEMLNKELSPTQIKELVGKLKPEASQALLHELEMQESVKKYLRELIIFMGQQPRTEKHQGLDGFRNTLEEFMGKMKAELMFKDLPFPLERVLPPASPIDTPVQDKNIANDIQQPKPQTSSPVEYPGLSDDTMSQIG